MSIGSVVGTWEHASSGAASTNVDYTNKVLAFSTDLSRDAVESTTFSLSSRTYEAGLKTGEINVTYKYDDTINDIIEDLWSNGTSVTFEYSPLGSTAPNMTGSMICTGMSLNVGVGERLEIEASFQVTGDVSFA